MPIHRVLLVAVLSALAAAALAAEPGAAVTPMPPDASDCAAIDAVVEPLPLGAGLRAFIDLTTGRLRQPTSAELAATAASSRFSNNESIEGLEVEIRKDGSKFVDLQGRFMHSLVVTRNADGSTRFNCTAGDPHTHPSTKPTAAPSAPAEK